jgi:hypothetical protein
MSQLLQPTAPVSNPDTVMRMIAAARPQPTPSIHPPRAPKLRLHTEDETSAPETDNWQRAPKPRQSDIAGHPSPTPLHLASDTAPGSSDLGSSDLASENSDSSHNFAMAQPPTPQVQQLVDHLHRRQKELAQREADLQAEVYHWDKQVLASKASINKRAAELEQHLTQVEQQQSLLVKLQQNLIDSQTAIRATVERLIEQSDAGELKSELLNLQVELGNRFDEILNRWDRVSQWS